MTSLPWCSWRPLRPWRQKWNSQRPHFHERLRPGRDADRVAQRAAEVLERDDHLVAVFESHAVFEAEQVGAEEVNVDVARVAVLGVFEMVVLEVRERVAHPFLAAGLGTFPNDGPGPLKRGLAKHLGEVSVHD